MRWLMVTVMAAVVGCAQDLLSQQRPQSQVSEVRATFEVRYVANDALYINGGREEGLQEGFHLQIKRVKPGEAILTAQSIGQVVITAVSAHSAACMIETSAPDSLPQVGDLAQISREDLEALQVMAQSKTARRYAQVVSFSAGDPLDQELRDYVPKAPSPAINQIRGRLSYEYSTIRDHDTGVASTQNGIALRIDATRLGGSFWNLTGYWRGRFNSTNSSTTGAQLVTITDLLNRTYQIGLFYNNPNSPNTMGFGRLYVPWVVSQGSIDGGYYGRHLNRNFLVGAFAGSTPDPTTWNYTANRQIASTFANAQVGSFENVRLATTVGLAITRLSFKAERQYAYSETTFSWKRYVSIFQNNEADDLVAGRLGNAESGPVMSRSFSTLRVEPAPWLILDANYNYFRTIPTFDLVLVGTGLLDKYLFSGFSTGARIELPRRMSVYGNVGQSKRNGDSRGSLNQMYGISFRDVRHIGVRLDVRRSVFNGSFGSGTYESLSLGKELRQNLRFDVLAGRQDFTSSLASATRGYFVNSNIDWFFSRHYVVGGGVNLFRGSQNYDQTFLSLGYRY